MSNEPHLFSDDPVDGSTDAPDLLDLNEYVGHVVELLSQVRLQGSSSVLSLIADWGAGKSSIIEMIKRRLAATEPGRPQWLIAEFNPWVYSDFQSM